MLGRLSSTVYLPYIKFRVISQDQLPFTKVFDRGDEGSIKLLKLQQSREIYSIKCFFKSFWDGFSLESQNWGP